MSKASVSSLEALETLELALAQFAERAATSVDQASSDAQRGVEELEDRRRYWADQVRYRQQEYDLADPEEDDLSSLAYRLQEAEEQLANVERWLQRVEDCFQFYSRQASQLDDLVSGRITEARGFLKRKIALMQEWVSNPPGIGTYISSAESVAGVSSASSFAVGGMASAFRSASMPIDRKSGVITDDPLPAGFRWVNLEDISPEDAEQLPDDGAFHKVEYEEMRRGFEVLKSGILPLLRDSPQNANSDYFWQRDHEQGFDESNGAQRVFNAFFGTSGEHIQLERGKGDRYFRITNGRHRIKVARDLGWPAVPVKAVEVD